MLNDRVAVLASGGVDSNILLALMLKRYGETYPVYIRAGFCWEGAEIHWLKKYMKALPHGNLKPLTVLHMPASDIFGDRGGWAVTGRGIPGYDSPDEDVFLPGRNLLLLSKMATFCALKKIPRIALGTLSSNPFPDAAPRFFRHFERTAETALNFPIKILTPFAHLKKKDIVKKARGLPLHLSFSCLAPKGRNPCGRCNKCAEKDKVFAA